MVTAIYISAVSLHRWSYHHASPLSRLCVSPMGSDATSSWGSTMRLGCLYSHDATDARSAPSMPHAQPRLYTRSQLGRFRSHTSPPSTLWLRPPPSPQQPQLPCATHDVARASHAACRATVARSTTIGPGHSSSHGQGLSSLATPSGAPHAHMLAARVSPCYHRNRSYAATLA